MIKNKKPIEDIVSMWISKYPELSFLTLEIEATPEKSSRLIDGYGKLFFPCKSVQELIEFNRTVMSLFALKYLYEKNYEQFCLGQSAEAKITEQTFNLLHNWCYKILNTPELLEAMNVFLVINDLGKIQKYIDIAKTENFQSADHDEILSFLLQEKKEQIPSYNSLAANEKSILFQGAKTNFNMGQFLRTENLPFHLKAIKNQDKKTADFFLLHTFLDIAGANGHINDKGPILANELICQDFLNALKAIELLQGGASPEWAYTYYLSFKARKLGAKIMDSKQIPVLRLAHLFNIQTKERYGAIEQIINNLKNEDKKILLKSMSHGNNNGEMELERYIFIYYAPALFSNILSNVKWSQLSEREQFYQGAKLGIDTFVSIFKYCNKNHANKNCLIMARSLAIIAQKNIDYLIDKVNLEELEFELFSMQDNLVSIKV